MNSYQDDLNKLLSYFTKSFDNAYKNIKIKNKKNLLKYLPIIYRKWFYSVLSKNVSFTPSILFETLKRKYKKELCTYPNISYKIGTGNNYEIRYDVKHASVFSHPLLFDLKIFIDNSYPHIVATEEGSLSEEFLKNISDKTGIYDSAYIDYLFSIAESIGLIKKTPSIYIQCFQPTEQVETFFKQGEESCLNEIVESTIKIFIQYLNSVVGCDILTSEDIINLLKNPVTVVEIYTLIFEKIGLDYDQMISLFSGKTKEDTLLSDIEVGDDTQMTSMMIYIVTKWVEDFFLVPFSSYLKIIQIYYSDPHNIYASLVNYNKIENGIHQILNEYDTISVLYELLPLGCELLKAKITKVENVFNYIKPFEVSEAIEFINFSFDFSSLDVVFDDDETSDCENIYQFKIISKDDPKIWITLEVFEDITLQKLSDYIIFYFNIVPINGYKFIVGEQETPFNTYKSSLSAKSRKNAKNVELIDLNLEVNSKINYFGIKSENQIIIFDKELDYMDFTITLTKINSNDSMKKCPTLVRQCKTLKDIL